MPKISPLGQNLWPTGREHTQRGYITKKLPKNLKIVMSRSNLKRSKNTKNTIRMVILSVINAKNQPPKPKTVAYRPQTHTQRIYNKKLQKI